MKSGVCGLHLVFVSSDRGCGMWCVCVSTQLVAAALGDAVHVHLAEVPGTEVDARRMQQHAAQSPQSALCWQASVARHVCLWTPETRRASTYPEKNNFKTIKIQTFDR